MRYRVTFNAGSTISSNRSQADGSYNEVMYPMSSSTYISLWSLVFSSDSSLTFSSREAHFETESLSLQWIALRRNGIEAPVAKKFYF